MNPIKFVCFVGLFACSIFVLTQATVGGQYSLNVHFVPPLVTAPCSIAQFWTPSNVTCAMCFCMTGTLSRCVPQPGCNPLQNNGTTTTTPIPGANETMEAVPDGNTDSNGSSPPPASNSTTSATTTTTTENSQASDASTPSPDENNAIPGRTKTRAAKPSKVRRRRYSGNPMTR